MYKKFYIYFKQGQIKNKLYYEFIQKHHNTSTKDYLVLKKKKKMISNAKLFKILDNTKLNKI